MHLCVPNIVLFVRKYFKILVNCDGFFMLVDLLIEFLMRCYARCCVKLFYCVVVICLFSKKRKLKSQYI